MCVVLCCVEHNFFDRFGHLELGGDWVEELNLLLKSKKTHVVRYFPNDKKIKIEWVVLSSMSCNQTA